MVAAFHMQEQLQQAQAEQQQLQRNPQHASSAANHHHPCNAAGSWPAFDTAVQQLKQRSDSSQLPGCFYGRLCNMLSITEAHSNAAVAVNAALAEVANLNSTLLVSDRSTAAAVINHFRQQRVGTVQCKILSEAPAAVNPPAAAANNSSSSSSSRPLLECVQAAPGVAGLQGLLQQLLGSWLLVERREEASRLLHLRRNIVTR
jgi:chromosome segregation ATPase